MNRLLILVLLLFSAHFSSAQKETWTLTSKDGRTIEVDYIFYDGVELTLRKVGAMNKIKIAPDVLDKASWTEIQDEFSREARLDVNVTRRTKTKTETDRKSYSGFYDNYSQTTKDIEKLNLFDVKVESTSHFVTALTVEYFIFNGESVEYGQIPGKVSLREPFKTTLEKSTSGRTYTSNYGGYYNSYYKSGSGAKTAEASIILLDLDGKEITKFANSNKLMEFTDRIKMKEREAYKKKNPQSRR